MRTYFSSKEAEQAYKELSPSCRREIKLDILKKRIQIPFDWLYYTFGDDGCHTIIGVGCFTVMTLALIYLIIEYMLYHEARHIVLYLTVTVLGCSLMWASNLVIDGLANIFMHSSLVCYTVHEQEHRICVLMNYHTGYNAILRKATARSNGDSEYRVYAEIELEGEQRVKGGVWNALIALEDDHMIAMSGLRRPNNGVGDSKLGL